MNTLQIQSGRDLSRLPSSRLWSDCPWQDIVEGKAPDRIGYARHYDFSELRTLAQSGSSFADAYYADGFRAFLSDGGTVAALAAQSGGATLSADGDNEGVSITDSVPRFQLDRGKKNFWLELALRTSTITDTKHGFFAGLIDTATLSATVPIAAAGTLADENLVGFHRLEGDGDQLDTVYKANGVTQVTVDSDVLDGGTYGGGTLPSALAADTQVKLGIKYTATGHKRGDYWVSFWVNGVELPEGKQVPTGDGDDFPNDVQLGFVFALLNATGSTPGSTSLLWVRMAQLY